MSDQRVGDYLLGEPIEEGSYTVICRGQQRRLPLGPGSGGRAPQARAVLVKVTRAGVELTAELEQAFARELRALCRIAHPVLPTVVDYVRDGSRLALVYADSGGVRLDELLARTGRLEPRLAVAVAVEIARGLSAIHRYGGVHGKLRAAEVELTASGAVRLHGYDGSGHLPTSADSSEALLLPDDMAPEQIVSEPAEAATDVYLWGTLLYQMLAGKKPFDDGAPGIARRIRHQRVPPLRRLAPTVPVAVERLVLRCLRKAPKDRPPSAALAAAELERVRSGSGSLAADLLIAQAVASTGLVDGPSLPAEAPAPPRRGLARRLRRKLALPLGIVVAVLAAALVVARVTHRPPSRSSAEAQGIADRPARLRVLAQPWAEVYVDGDYVDTTPIGRPIVLSPGRHQVRFRHPNAPDEVRAIEVIAAQSIVLDVTMKVSRPPSDAAPTGDAASIESP